LEWQYNPGGPIETIESGIEETSPGGVYTYKIGLLEWLFENTKEEHIDLWVVQIYCGKHCG
jgi:hypothetical protein